VEERLRDLTISIGTGIGHPGDETRARHMFKKLIAQGIELNPSAIKRWALQHQWDKGSAMQLAEFARETIWQVKHEAAASSTWTLQLVNAMQGPAKEEQPVAVKEEPVTEKVPRFSPQFWENIKRANEQFAKKYPPTRPRGSRLRF
jgi:hypothetical protein